MEQHSHYLMYMKHTKQYHNILNSSHFQASSIKSWEEQAFAEDSQGPLGGFIWPPRSYTCSFCKREFRSAQALGGHMNVHRRDRARLKQGNNTSNGSQTEDCTSDSNPSNFVTSPPTTRDFCQETNVSSLFSSSLVRSQQNYHESANTSYYGSTTACKKNIRREDSEFEEHVETNLCVGLNFNISRNLPSRNGGGDEDGKKRKRDSMKLLPFLMKSCSNDKEIDLELRLGDSSAVK